MLTRLLVRKIGINLNHAAEEMSEHLTAAQAAGEITRLWAQMCDRAGNLPGEDYLARVGRLNALRKQAEEIVLAELILLPPEPGASEDDPAVSA